MIRKNWKYILLVCSVFVLSGLNVAFAYDNSNHPVRIIASRYRTMPYEVFITPYEVGLYALDDLDNTDHRKDVKAFLEWYLKRINNNDKNGMSGTIYDVILYGDKEKVLPQYDVDYVYYCVESHNVQHQIRRKTKGAGQATITVEDIREFEIPLPPIEIQSEIVHTLDNYTENVVKLQNQLTAELTARQKQYTFYRNKLLTFSGNEKAKIVKISLGDIGPICMCKRILKSQTNTVEGVPFYKIGTFGKKADAYISKETFDEYQSKYNLKTIKL